MQDKTKEIIEIFSKKLPHIFNTDDIRKNQIQMALDVSDFLFNKPEKIMFVEAPVGTGKSLGLLVPCSLYSKQKKKPILYATATINLQNQIFEKDSDTLSKLNLIKPNEKIVAQGKNNYTCQSAFRANRTSFSVDEIKLLENFFKNCKTGLFSELHDLAPNFDQSPENKDLISMQGGYRCLRENSCPSHEHRRNYKSLKNKLVITNHDQLIQSFINENNPAIRNPIIYYDNRVLIIDEAHSLKENYLGRTVETLSLRDLKQVKHWVPSELKEKYQILLLQLQSLEKTLRLKQETNYRHKIDEKTLNSLTEITDIIDKTLIQDTNQVYSNSKIDLLEHLHEKLENIINTNQNKSWYQFDCSLIFQSVTLDFNTDFMNMIIKLSHFSKIIFMSGTLTTGEKIKDIQRDWGIAKSRFIYKGYSNVFDLKKQAIIYVPKKLPHPNKDSHLPQITHLLPPLVNSTSGGTLILCTSNSYMNNIYSAIKNSPKYSQKVLCQGKGSPQTINDEFSRDINSILVGSGAYFTGFSVEGKALNKLLLTKLPFPAPEDPYLELISKDTKKELFYQNFIQRTMFTKLEQGLGRLIRSQTDFGFITIFDKRVFTPAIKTFLEEIGYRITQDSQEVRIFMNTLNKNGVSLEQAPFSVNQLVLPNKPEHTKFQSYGLWKTAESYVSRETYLENKNKNQRYLKGLSNWLNFFIEEHNTKDITFDISKKMLNTPFDFYVTAANFSQIVGLQNEILKNSFPFNSAFSHREKHEFFRLLDTGDIPYNP